MSHDGEPLLAVDEHGERPRADVVHHVELEPAVVDGSVDNARLVVVVHEPATVHVQH